MLLCDQSSVQIGITTKRNIIFAAVVIPNHARVSGLVYKEIQHAIKITTIGVVEKFSDAII